MEFETGKAAREYAMEFGLEGEALDLFVKGGAAERHNGRVAAARDALTEAAHAVLTTANAGGDYYRPAVAAFIAAMDANGIGGRAGAGGPGCATTRHPALSHLGTGRKQAGDGRAWDAAIAEAAAELLLPSVHVTVSCTDDGIVFCYGDADHIMTVEPPTLGPDHVRAMARQALMASGRGEVQLALLGWTGGTSSLVFAGTLQALAALAVT